MIKKPDLSPSYCFYYDRFKELEMTVRLNKASLLEIAKITNRNVNNFIN